MIGSSHVKICSFHYDEIFAILHQNDKIVKQERILYMLRIAICDDESDARDALRFALEKVMDEKNEQIAYEFSNGKNAIHWLKNHPGEVDLLFLDIEMEPIDGMSVAKEIRTFDNSIILVFVTGYTDYVFDGYAVNAMDYIVKPINTNRLQSLISRVREAIHQITDSHLVFHNTLGTYRIKQEDILYLYSDKRLIYVVLDEKEISFYGRLDNLERTLDAYFVRIHQRYLVNGKKVSFIGSDFINIKDINLPLSRSQKNYATSELAKIMLGE